MSKKEELAITKMMEVLELSREEAIEMLKSDKEDNIEEEVKKEEKPKKKTDSLAKVKMQKAKKKEDLVKDGLMKAIKDLVKLNETAFTNSQEMTSSKITFTSTDGNFYSISLTKHKVKPDGYSEK